MRIVCPSCDAAYEVPESLLGDDAQVVRCARCGGEWTPERTQSDPVPGLIPPAPASAPTSGFEPDRQVEVAVRPDGVSDDAARPAVQPRAAGGLSERLAARQRRVEPREPELPSDAFGSLRVSLLSRRMQLFSAAAWLASLTVLVAAAGTLYVRRPEIQAIWPASERLYRLLGLT